jgi:hypothetical protein
VAAAHPGTLNTATAGRLFFVNDSISSKKLLVDTGSTYSIFPFHFKARPFGPRLKAANGQRIRCWGSRPRHLHVAGRSYQWQFLQAEVSFPGAHTKRRKTKRRKTKHRKTKRRKTKHRKTKRRHIKTSTITKPRQLQNVEIFSISSYIQE